MALSHLFKIVAECEAMASTERVAEVEREVARMQALMGAQQASIEEQKKSLVLHPIGVHPNKDGHGRNC